MELLRLLGIFHRQEGFKQIKILNHIEIAEDLEFECDREFVVGRFFEHQLDVVARIDIGFGFSFGVGFGFGFGFDVDCVVKVNDDPIDAGIVNRIAFSDFGNGFREFFCDRFGSALGESLNCNLRDVRVRSGEQKPCCDKSRRERGRQGLAPAHRRFACDRLYRVLRISLDSCLQPRAQVGGHRGWRERTKTFVECEVRSDPIQPGRKLGLRAISILRAVHPQERFLNQFLRGTRIDDHPLEVVEQRPSPAIKERVEGRAISRAKASIN